MKKVITSLLVLMASAVVASAQIVKQLEEPTDKEFRKAVKTLMYKTNGHDITPKRMEAMESVQAVFNRFTHTAWSDYLGESDPAKVAELERTGIPYFLRNAFEKVRKEVATTKVKEGTVAIWLLYNMGYIVKTPTSTFGIDIYSRYAEDLLDMIDFVMITHAHGDHYTKEMAEGMTRRNKPVFANFDIAEANVTRVEDGKVYEVGDVKIRTTIGDHNAQLLNYVVAYEIDCGESTDNTILYHTGDSYNYTQLNPQQQVDIFIPHMAVSLDIQSYIDKFKPRHVFLSHLHELGHSIEKWRWTFHDALDLKSRLRHDHIWIPCWGEKVVYDRSNW